MGVLRHLPARIAEQAPLPQHVVAGVLQSPGLLPSLLASLEVDDGQAASVCTAWRQAWRDIDHRVLREVNPPMTQPDGVKVLLARTLELDEEYNRKRAARERILRQQRSAVCHAVYEVVCQRE